MDSLTLTDGSIAAISDGDPAVSRPLLQITDLRLVQTAQNSAERFRMVLSDGVYAQQAMLATPMNVMVRDGRLKKGSIIRLNEFLCNLVQTRKIIIALNLDLVVETAEIIGEPRAYDSSSSNAQAKASAPASSGNKVSPAGNTQSTLGVGIGGPVGGPNVTTGAHLQSKSSPLPNGGSSTPGSFAAGNGNSSSNATYNQRFQTPGTAMQQQHPVSAFSRQANTSFQQLQPPPLYQNRGPITRNEAPARIIPIAALSPYHGRWTIKARVTAKGELRRYNSPKGEGKVFSFDLLDCDGGEIRVTCFNTVADQFYDQIDAGRVYLISKGSVKPAQKNFNHLNNDYEIYLENTSTIQPCLEEDNSIPKQQFNFRPINQIEEIENNTTVDLIGIVTSINPASTIQRKNGTETLKRTLNLKDMSGRSVEITLWGNFCNAEGQQLQNMCDSGMWPVLAIKAGRVSDFSGKSVGTISTSQLLIDPDFPEAHSVRDWYNKEGKTMTFLSLSREMTSVGKMDVRKTVSQIKDEGLGRSEKPDWITVKATVSFIKSDNFCYTACPLMVGDRQCNKKVINNGDGNWHCDRCDQSFPECDYRYLLQFQIQDHSGLTWVTAFQESGQDIMGISAKELYLLKYEEQDDVKFADILRSVLFHQYLLKLKIKEETFSDEQRIKSTVVKAEKTNPSSESRYLLNAIDKLLIGEDPAAVSSRPESLTSDIGTSYPGHGNGQFMHNTASVGSNLYGRNGISRTGMEGPLHQGGQFQGQFGTPAGQGVGMRGVQSVCNSCGSVGHSAYNCPKLSNGTGQQMGAGFVNRASYTSMSGGSTTSGASGNCYKCQQPGHWARDCPGSSGISSAHGGGNPSGRFGFSR